MATTTHFPTTDEAASREPSQTTEQVRQLADRVVSGAHSLADRASERVSPAVEKLRASASGAGASLRSHAQDLVAREEQMVEHSRGSIRAHPLTWVAGAFAIGLLIGHLGSRDY